MKQTSLCYIRRGEDCLLLHRNKKKDDANADKWIGLGGKFLDGESPEDCVLREVEEESGLRLQSYEYRGIVTFESDCWEGEHMHLFTADSFTGTLRDCDEGALVWRPFQDLFHLPRWAGDDLFLTLLEQRSTFFSLKVRYCGETLMQAWLDGKELVITGGKGVLT